MIADGDTSLPVPAVVGIAITGAGLEVSAPKSSQSRGCPPLVSRTAAHFAVSIADPPPTPTNRSTELSRARSAGFNAVDVARVGLHVVEHRDRNSRGFEVCDQSSGDAESRHARVGDEYRAAAAELLCRFANAARDSLPEDHSRRHLEEAIGADSFATSGQGRMDRVLLGHGVLRMPPAAA
jgi:hypothetical protein